MLLAAPFFLLKAPVVLIPCNKSLHNINYKTVNH